MSELKLAKKIVQAVLDNLSDRCGFDFDDIEEDVMRDLRRSLTADVNRLLEARAPSPELEALREKLEALTGAAGLAVGAMERWGAEEDGIPESQSIWSDYRALSTILDEQGGGNG